MTNEEQAIEELTNMVMGEETPAQEAQEAPAEEAQETQAQEAQETPAQETQEAKVDNDTKAEVKIDVAEIIKRTMDEQSKRFEEKLGELAKKIDKQEEKELSEEELMIQQAKEKLGLEELQKQQQEMYEMYQKQQQQLQMQEKLDKMEEEFTKANPNIKLKELDKWATENGLTEQMQLGFESGNVAIWNVLADAMQKVAEVKNKPDPITPTASKGAETTVWERQKRGEEVSDIDIGADLLKTAGLLG